MYCPKCGQQQVSEEMRFCSRCGFQLGAVTSLLASGGASPADITAASQDGKPLRKNRHAQQGAKMMFASGVLLPVAIAFSIIFDSPIPLLLPLTVLIAGLAWLFYFRLFGEEASLPSGTNAPAQVSAAKQTFLPASHAAHASAVPNPSHRTAEIVQPPSVTEHTTRLLDEK
jgi:hypothetical protein